MKTLETRDQNSNKEEEHQRLLLRIHRLIMSSKSGLS